MDWIELINGQINNPSKLKRIGQIEWVGFDFAIPN